jgi:metal-dependent amidase/aminoacylase/carboxypeptidase family protein
MRQAVDLEELKRAVTAEVEAHREELVELSLRIHQNPEL